MHAAFATALAAAAVACSAEKPDGLAGYAEADTLYLAPQESGLIRTLAVKEGDRVAAGDPLFALDSARLGYSAQQATAAAQGVEARTADDGSMEKQIAEAETSLTLAAKTFERSRSLVKGGAVSKEKYDIDAAAFAQAKARVEQLRAERSAALRDLEAARAGAGLAERRIADLTTTAPASGTIERIYRRPGEVVLMGDPVVALLPPENIKLKFFAPQSMLPVISVGAEISFSCDGCGEARTATISFIATEPQYTPPVIYSLKEREKLVFLVEARPKNPDGIRPGLPVTIDLP